MFKRVLLLVAAVGVSGCQLQSLIKPENTSQEESSDTSAKASQVTVETTPGNVAPQKPVVASVKKPEVSSLKEEDPLKAEQSNAILAGRLAVINARLHEVCPVSDYEKGELKQWSNTQDQLYLGNQGSPFKSYYEHGKGIAITYTTDHLKDVLAVTSKDSGVSFTENCKIMVAQVIKKNAHLRALSQTETEPPTFSF
ncbi:hypothetical protein [Aliamphritea ceti]|uniref:hypothetical protein n=1 Tax=Aliamphritea ceti TaxID=1524258 RepID=UPI0021C43143|nr:hypothetical protein [Aliamphritea ceti]